MRGHGPRGHAVNRTMGTARRIAPFTRHNPARVCGIIPFQRFVGDAFSCCTPHNRTQNEPATEICTEWFAHARVCVHKYVDTRTCTRVCLSGKTVTIITGYSVSFRVNKYILVFEYEDKSYIRNIVKVSLIVMQKSSEKCCSQLKIVSWIVTTTTATSTFPITMSQRE